MYAGCCSSLGFGVGGQSCSNFPASTVVYREPGRKSGPQEISAEQHPWRLPEFRGPKHHINLRLSQSGSNAQHKGGYQDPIFMQSFGAPEVVEAFRLIWTRPVLPTPGTETLKKRAGGY